jgi:cyclomaltodextrinase / maltogenic alpha-amylase / neopullulanase
MWADQSVFYQIYPLGFCVAPQNNDGICVSRIKKIEGWVEHIKACGCNAIYFSPLFESDSHGYDTRDYSKLDCRLGTNTDFAEVCKNLHENKINIVLDGVFNHVGRGFWAFQDVLRNRESSPYKDWFYIHFDGNSNYNDGLWYEGWEGHYELVKLNLHNEEVINHIFSCIKKWVDEFHIDGLRLDVAYCLDRDFLQKLHTYCDGLKSDFFLVGEILGGDYNQIMNDSMLHSVTNYECYKGLYSSFNSMNLFEIAHSLNRQFGPEDWTLYKGKHLFNFVDNHDVARIATLLSNENHLPLIYAILFGMPGIPCVYYGSEWGAEGAKEAGSDASLRPCFEQPRVTELTQFIASCAKAHVYSKALCYGDYKSLLITNKQFLFERSFEGNRVIVAINADSTPFTAHFNANAGRARDLISGQIHDFGGGSELAPYSAYYWEIF